MKARAKELQILELGFRLGRAFPSLEPEKLSQAIRAAAFARRSEDHSEMPHELGGDGLSDREACFQALAIDFLEKSFEPLGGLLFFESDPIGGNFIMLQAPARASQPAESLRIA